MKAAVLHEVNKPLVIEEIEHDNPGPREVLVRTVAAGVCHSDLHFQNGSYPYPMPAVLGHESAGIVEAVGSQVTYVKPGDHVITCLSAFCGHCEYCLTGHMSLCQEPELQRATDQPQRLSKDGSPVAQFLNLFCRPPSWIDGDLFEHCNPVLHQTDGFLKLRKRGVNLHCRYIDTRLHNLGYFGIAKAHNALQNLFILLVFYALGGQF